jgi:hypothetical protein
MTARGFVQHQCTGQCGSIGIVLQFISNPMQMGQVNGQSRQAHQDRQGQGNEQGDRATLVRARER